MQLFFGTNIGLYALPENINLSSCNPIYNWGSGMDCAPLGVFPKYLQNKMKFCHFNFTPLRHILHTLTMLIVLRCWHGNLLFPVCHITSSYGKMKKLE